ncbi:MAG: GtrA family protein [Alphaproteobacteria bacterium]|nr:GtrA family protein [Alphaproteobacteria bacterium]
MIKIGDRQFIKYIIVGIWNTVFGYMIYALLTWFLDSHYNFRYSYMFSFIVSNFISISQAFVAHKFLVFKTKGNFWKEYKKGWIVYGSTALMSFIALPFFVELFGYIFPEPYKWLDKYIGGISVTGLAAIGSFFGHKKITFNTF